MAKRTKAEEEATGVSEEISEKKLKSLLASARSNDKDVRELSGSINSKIATAVENDNLHKKAFSTIRAADRMTPEKLADWWDHVQLYMDLSGLSERAKSAPRLRLEPDKEEADEENAGKAEGKGNVEPFPQPRGTA